MKSLFTFFATAAVAAGTTLSTRVAQSDLPASPVPDEPQAALALELPPEPPAPSLAAAELALAQEPAAPPAPTEVPLLADVPVIANLFGGTASTEERPQDDEELERLKRRLVELEAELADREAARAAREMDRRRLVEVRSAERTEREASRLVREAESQQRRIVEKELAKSRELMAVETERAQRFLDQVAAQSQQVEAEERTLQAQLEAVQAATAEALVAAQQAQNEGRTQEARGLRARYQERLAAVRVQSDELRAKAEGQRAQARELANVARARRNEANAAAVRERANEARARAAEVRERAAQIRERAAVIRERPTEEPLRAEELVERLAENQAEARGRALVRRYAQARPGQSPAPTATTSIQGGPIHIHVNGGDVHVHNGGSGGGLSLHEGDTCAPSRAQTFLGRVAPRERVTFHGPVQIETQENDRLVSVKAPKGEFITFGLSTRSGSGEVESVFSEPVEVEFKTPEIRFFDTTEPEWEFEFEDVTEEPECTEPEGQNTGVTGLFPDGSRLDLAAWHQAASRGGPQPTVTLESWPQAVDLGGGAGGATGGLDPFAGSGQAPRVSGARSVPGLSSDDRIDELMRLVREVRSDVRALRSAVHELRGEVESAPRRTTRGSSRSFPSASGGMTAPGVGGVGGAAAPGTGGGSGQSPFAGGAGATAPGLSGGSGQSPLTIGAGATAPRVSGGGAGSPAAVGVGTRRLEGGARTRR